MFPVRQGDSAEELYRERLALLRERILGFVVRRIVPREAGFGEAEEIAQSCVVALWEQYPEKRELAEMTAIAIGIARNKVAQFRRERDRETRAVAAATPAVEDWFERFAAREAADRFLRAMLDLSPRCRELMRLKLVEQHDYAEIRLRMGITGNIYEMAKRCHQALLRIAGGVR